MAGWNIFLVMVQLRWAGVHTREPAPHSGARPPVCALENGKQANTGVQRTTTTTPRLYFWLDPSPSSCPARFFGVILNTQILSPQIRVSAGQPLQRFGRFSAPSTRSVPLQTSPSRSSSAAWQRSRWCTTRAPGTAQKAPVSRAGHATASAGEVGLALVTVLASANKVCKRKVFWGASLLSPPPAREGVSSQRTAMPWGPSCDPADTRVPAQGTAPPAEAAAGRSRVTVTSSAIAPLLCPAAAGSRAGSGETLVRPFGA